jgi:hypothetical protein
MLFSVVIDRGQLLPDCVASYFWSAGMVGRVPPPRERASKLSLRIRKKASPFIFSHIGWGAERLQEEVKVSAEALPTSSGCGVRHT